MFAGHFGIAAAVKAKAMDLPVWALIISTQVLDIVFIPLALLGIESMGDPISAGRGNVIHAEYSHSLVGALLLSLIAGILAARVWGKKNGWVIGLVTFSHWIIDLIVHVPDLPILPGNLGNLPYMGFGLWQFATWSILLEALILIIGAILYLFYTFNHSNKKWNNKAIIQGVTMTLFLALSFVTGV